MPFYLSGFWPRYVYGIDMLGYLPFGILYQLERWERKTSNKLLNMHEIKKFLFGFFYATQLMRNVS